MLFPAVHWGVVLWDVVLAVFSPHRVTTAMSSLQSAWHQHLRLPHLLWEFLGICINLWHLWPCVTGKLGSCGSRLCQLLSRDVSRSIGIKFLKGFDDLLVMYSCNFSVIVVFEFQHFAVDIIHHAVDSWTLADALFRCKGLPVFSLNLRANMSQYEPIMCLLHGQSDEHQNQSFASLLKLQVQQTVHIPLRTRTRAQWKTFMFKGVLAWKWLLFSN